MLQIFDVIQSDVLLQNQVHWNWGLQHQPNSATEPSWNIEILHEVIFDMVLFS